MAEPILAVRSADGPSNPEAALALRNLSLTSDGNGATLLRGVDLTVRTGEVHGLVGETGAGKSLAAWSVLGLLPPGVRRVGGSIRLAGHDLTAATEDDLRRLRGREVAMIVQNPKSALVPTMTIGAQLALVHRARTGESRRQSRRLAIEALADMQIREPERRARDYPHQLSGGQAQRVVIAMALLSDPKLVIADEATTGLDVTVQAAVLDLLVGRVRERGASLLLITHDLGVVANYADTTSVMFAGEVIETGSTVSVFETPSHPYVKGLLAAAALSGREERQGKLDMSGPPPDLRSRPTGCQFGYRCPIHQPQCDEPVTLVPLVEDHQVRCVRAPEVAGARRA